MKGLSAASRPPSDASGNIQAHLAVLGDVLRCRVLLVLERQELTVSELCTVLQLPQSTASRHLNVLVRHGWLAVRREGTSRRYSIDRDAEHSDSRTQLWSLVRAETAATASAHEDLRRLESVLARRRSRSKDFFSSTAAHWAGMRRDLFGQRFDLEALLGLLDSDWIVGDLGAGTGQLAKSVAPYVARVIAVDDSAAMLDAAAKRLEGSGNVELRHGRLESLPIEDGVLDAATLVLVLHHLPKPEEVLVEATRALKPGGKLLVVDMLPHEREEFRSEMGHAWLGFDLAAMVGALEQAGLDQVRGQPLTPDPEAKGPGLFVAVGRKPAAKRLEFPVKEAIES